MTSEEREKLRRISESSLYSSGVMSSAIGYCFRILQRHISGENILEMGPAEGLMTELLTNTNKKLTVLEGSELFCNSLRQRFPHARVVHSLFEEFDPSDTFDTIVMGHVLEHVQDPVLVLTKARRWLKRGGRIFAAVPNAHSIHRQAAVIMNILPREDALNDMDWQHGHRRVFDAATFKKVFLESGLSIDIFGGYWMKPVSNKQIENSWTPEMVEAFMQLGEDYPDIAAEIYIVASSPESSARAIAAA